MRTTGWSALRWPSWPKHVRAGVTTLELDRIAEDFIRSHGAVPGFLGYNGFPNTLCISVNEQVVHGIPSSKVVLKDGDVVSVDCGTFMKGFYGDSAYTFAVGKIAPEAERLLRVTKEALYKGVAQAQPGHRIGDIGYAVQEHAEKHGYSVVREMVGHGRAVRCTRTLRSPTTEREAEARCSRRAW